jgi:ribose 1,5-bisphosphokinase
VDGIGQPRVVIGPSGAGKTTLARAFASAFADRFELVLTHTTRARRPGEGDTHVFVTDAEFDGADYLGTLDIFGARYGLPPLPRPRVALVVLRAAALDQFTALFPDARIIQVEAPPEILAERLRARGDPERASQADLRQEIAAGRTAADGIVRTDQPFERSLAEFAKLVGDA